jgi:selenide,water dikinase
MSPEDLGRILAGLPRAAADPRVLVDATSADDAGVYQLDEERALAFTVDIITPLVDDPRDFGRIAAANSISDIYAMGGRPLMAVNVCGFEPSLPATVYQEILSGAAEIAARAGIVIVGGHTIKDKEIKYGLAVVGEVHPDRILRNTPARAGDVLLLSKALGTSALSTALKNGAFDETDSRYRSLVDSMTRLNREASEVALAHGAHALTDITGFGLSGHLLEMIGSSGLRFEIDLHTLPVLDGALDMLRAGQTCGGGHANRKRASDATELFSGIESFQEDLLHDPQTSGGLLLALPASAGPAALAELRASGHAAQIIGRVAEGEGPALRILP